MGFSRQEHWSGLPCPPPEDLPHPGIEPTSLMPPTLVDGFFTTSATWEAPASSFILFCSVTPLYLTLRWTGKPGVLQSMGS